MILETQDLTWLTWSKVRNFSGTAGSFLKSYSDIGGRKRYYKLSNFDAIRGVIGHECVNEIIADRLLTLLGIEHLSYQLIHADIQIDGTRHTTWLCASEDFKQRGESKMALDAYYQAERHPGEKPLDFCLRQGWGEYIWKMLIVDYLILNRDRHGANIEVLRNPKKKTLRLAPLFDHGLSLIFSCTTPEAVEKVQPLQDKPIQCFVGSHSSLQNLQLIPKEQLPQLLPLRETDRAVLLEDLDPVLGRVWQDKIWDMIWGRWLAFEDFCRQR